MLDDGITAGKFLCKRLHQSLFIVIISDCLDGGEALPVFPLLDSETDILLHAGGKQVVTLSYTSKGVNRGGSGQRTYGHMTESLCLVGAACRRWPWKRMGVGRWSAGKQGVDGEAAESWAVAQSLGTFPFLDSPI